MFLPLLCTTRQILGCVKTCNKHDSDFYSNPSCATCSVFLVDHAWTYRVEYARQQLEQGPGLLPRMAALMGLDFHGEAPDADTVELVMEHMWKYNQTYRLSQGVRQKTLPRYSSLLSFLKSKFYFRGIRE